MQTVLIAIHLIIVLGLIGVVLLQRSEGGLGLGGGSGGGGVSGFMTGRGQANALTRATAILGTLFFATSLVLAIMAHRGTAPRSILEGTGRPGAPAAGQPAEGGGVLDELKRLQDGANAPAAPATPQVPQTR